MHFKEIPVYFIKPTSPELEITPDRSYDYTVGDTGLGKKHDIFQKIQLI